MPWNGITTSMMTHLTANPVFRYTSSFWTFINESPTTAHSDVSFIFLLHIVPHSCMLLRLRNPHLLWTLPLTETIPGAQQMVCDRFNQPKNKCELIRALCLVNISVFGARARRAEESDQIGSLLLHHATS